MTKRSTKKKRRNPAANLTDDLIVEILSRLPVKSICRFKCVSRHWSALISHPDHRRKLPQTLAGMFHCSYDCTRFPQVARHFTNIWETHRSQPLICPSLSFLPGFERITDILDSCNGLLLCRLRFDGQSSSQDASFLYAVCNPATQSSVVLPASGCGNKCRVTRLGFDPAVSLRFHVFEFEDWVDGVQIYSSRTGAWSYKERGIGVSFFSNSTNSVFLNGLLHFVTAQYEIVAIDVEGETWQMLTPPDYRPDEFDLDPGFLGQYQGQLCYINNCDYESDLSVWILKDYATDEWILKHQVSIQRLCLCKRMMSPIASRFYNVITVHPDCNLILYTVGVKNTLMAYDIDRKKAWVIKNLGSQRPPPYIPYVPFYSESLVEGHL